MFNRDAVINAWCVRQLAYWQARRPRYTAALEAYEALNASEGSVFLYEIRDGTVTLLDKPAFYTSTDFAARSDGLVDRAIMYRDFLQRVVRFRRPRGTGVLALGLHDSAYESETVPIFALGKPSGSHAILLNDVDFLVFGFHSLSHVLDTRPYAQKTAKAVFVGATTGSYHTERSIEALSNRRVRTAMAFKESDHVDFKLPVITQCESEAAAERLRALGFGVGDYGWSYQFRHKFIISMDGNGAAFSRVAIALKSRSVLLKYESSNELYYFSGMIPWLHYIPITSDDQIADIVQVERDNPGYFQYIADAGRIFYRTLLSRTAVMSYASRLIEMYFAAFATSVGDL